MTMDNDSIVYRNKYVNNGIVSIDAYKVFFAMVFLVFLKPSICEYYYFLDVAFNLFRFGLSTAYFILYLIASKGKLNIKLIELVIIYLIVLCNTLNFSGDIYKVTGHFIPVIGFMAFTEYYIEKVKDIIEVIFYEFGIMIILNMLSILWRPGGILTEGNLGFTPVWLLGQKQSWALCCIPFLFCGNIIRTINNRSNIFFWSCIVCFCISILRATPLGLIINIAVVLALSSLNEKFDIKISARNLVAVLILGLLATVLMAIRYNDLSGLQAFLGNINAIGMGKNKTVGVRTDMWLAGIKMFLSHPFLGVGRPSWRMVRNYGGIFYHTNLHSMIMDIGATAGSTGLLLYLLFVFGDVNKIIGKYKNDIVYVLVVSIFGICIENMTECLYTPFCFWILSLGQHADILAELLPMNRIKRYIKIVL